MTTAGVAPALDEAVQTVAGFLVADAPLGTTLERVASLAEGAIGPAVAVGLTLLDERGRPRTFVSTADLAPRIDQAQYDQNDGPCLAAYRLGQDHSGRRLLRCCRQMALVQPRGGRGRCREHAVLSVFRRRQALRRLQPLRP